MNKKRNIHMMTTLQKCSTSLASSATQESTGSCELALHFPRVWVRRLYCSPLTDAFQVIEKRGAMDWAWWEKMTGMAGPARLIAVAIGIGISDRIRSPLMSLESVFLLSRGVVH